MADKSAGFQTRSQNGRNPPKVAVIMVPFPAQGHLNQLLQLSRLISSYDIPVHYVGTATHNRQAKLRIHGWDPLSIANIHFHEFPTPSFLSPPPNSNSSVKFPSHLQPSFNASIYLRKPISGLLRVLSEENRRIIIIHDSLMGFVVQDYVFLPNAEAYIFHSVSAFTMFLFLWEKMGKPNITTIDHSEIPRCIPSLEGCFTPEFLEFLRIQHGYMKFSSGRIYNTCRVIEGTFLDLLEKESIARNSKHWALGPFNPVTVSEKKRPSQSHKCLEWLDNQAPNSVIFVSFGTTTSFSRAQINELALGLERSDKKFIWVLREADKGNVFVGGNKGIQLPKGFEERIKEKGLIMRDWAPQLEILAHPATGGFMSHCGWNSCLESLTMGVPIAAWPIHSDQPRNSVLLTEVLRVGITVKNWDRRDEIVSAFTVEKAVKRLMGSQEGKDMRKKAADVGAALRSAVAEGGVSRVELDSFIAHITR